METISQHDNYRTLFLEICQRTADRFEELDNAHEGTNPHPPFIERRDSYLAIKRKLEGDTPLTSEDYNDLSLAASLVAAELDAQAAQLSKVASNYRRIIAPLLKEAKENPNDNFYTKGEEEKE